MHKTTLLQFVRPSLPIITLLCLAHPALPSASNQPPARKYSNVERLVLPRLHAVHEDVLKLRAHRRAMTPLPDLNDHRCILHAHAEDSDHTGGTLPEMLVDAKKAGICAILLTDHFRPPRDFFDGRWRGLKDGVLFIPGSKTRGCLLYPEASVLDKMEQLFPDSLKAVTAGDGRVDLEAYHRSFWNSSTHILAPKLDEPTMRTALKAGHAYVAFDWMCEATGFRFEALTSDGKTAGIMGDEVKHADGMKLSAQFPLACQTRLLRNGVPVSETAGKDRVEFPVTEAGVYRLEAWLTVDGEPRPWIFSNPIYLR